MEEEPTQKTGIKHFRGSNEYRVMGTERIGKGFEMKKARW